LKAMMPFDTEKERKPLKIMEMSFSWRQVAYLVGSGVLTMELIQYTYNSHVSFLINILVFVLCLFAFTPGIVFSFFKHPVTGLFLDKHLLYHMRFKKRESGIWRRF